MPHSEHTDPSRDRDASGRPRNARARDGLGRPQPRGAAGVDRVPEDVTLPPAEALLEAQRLMDAGLPFHAHEVLEGTWKSAPPDERELWQGLAQLAVALTHLLRGNTTGAMSVLQRSRERLSGYRSAAPHDIDVQGLIIWCDATLTGLHSASDPSRNDVAVPQLTQGRVKD